MHAALALAPSAVVLVAVLGFRASGLVAAMLAALTAVAIWFVQAFAPLEPAQLARATEDAAILTLLVAGMIVPGILFVEATRERKSPEAIARLVTAIGLTGAKGAILIATGIGVMVESLTGMGVSLLITMPLLLALFDRRAAIGIGLVGMSLMPWGALSISAHVGAKLAAVPVEVLQAWIARISGPVAFLLPMLCLAFVKGRTSADFGVALLAGGVLSASIVLASGAIGVEVAGVAGGLAVIALMIALSPQRHEALAPLAQPGLFPYLVLLAAVLVQKLIVAPLAAAGIAPALDTGRVRFAILTSPGVALVAATLLASASSLRPSLAVTVAQRSWRPLLAVALFMLAARLLVECGAIAALAQSLGGLGRDGALVVVGLLGAVGGFVTGSGVTGNALFMPSAAAAGAALAPAGVTSPSPTLLIFAALQNGASGHVGMASLPVAAILVASLGQREAGDDALALRIGLGLAAVHVAVAIVAALLWLRVAA